MIRRHEIDKKNKNGHTQEFPKLPNYRKYNRDKTKASVVMIFAPLSPLAG